MVNYTNILTTTAIILALPTTAFAMQESKEEFRDSTMQSGSFCQKTDDDKYENNFSTGAFKSSIVRESQKSYEYERDFLESSVINNDYRVQPACSRLTSTYPHETFLSNSCVLLERKEDYISPNRLLKTLNKDSSSSYTLGYIIRAEDEAKCLSNFNLNSEFKSMRIQNSWVCKPPSPPKDRFLCIDKFPKLSLYGDRSISGGSGNAGGDDDTNLIHFLTSDTKENLLSIKNIDLRLNPRHDYHILDRIAYILSPKSFENVPPNFLSCIEKISPKFEEDKIQSYKSHKWSYKQFFPYFSLFTNFPIINAYEEKEKQNSEPFNLIHFPDDIFLSIFSWLKNDDYMLIAQVSRKLHNLVHNPSIALRHLESLAKNPALVGINIQNIEEKFKKLPKHTYLKDDALIAISFEKEFEQDIKNLWKIVKFHYEILRKKPDLRAKLGPSRLEILDDKEPLSTLALPYAPVDPDLLLAQWKITFDNEWNKLGYRPNFNTSTSSQAKDSEGALTEPFILSDFSGDILLTILSCLTNDAYMDIGQVSKKFNKLTHDPYVAFSHMQSLAKNPALVGINIQKIEEQFKKLPKGRFLKIFEKLIVEEFEKKFEKDINNLWKIFKLHYEILRKKQNLIERLELSRSDILYDKEPLGTLVYICMLSPESFPDIHPNFLNCIKEISPKLEEDKIKSYKYGFWMTIPSLETPHLQLESILPKKEGFHYEILRKKPALIERLELSRSEILYDKGPLGTLVIPYEPLYSPVDPDSLYAQWKMNFDQEWNKLGDKPNLNISISSQTKNSEGILAAPFILSDFSGNILLTILSWLRTDSYMDLGQVSKKFNKLTHDPYVAFTHLKSLAQNPALADINTQTIEEKFKELPEGPFLKKAEKSIVENFENKFEQNVKKLWKIFKFHYEILRMKQNLIERLELSRSDIYDKGPLGTLAYICMLSPESFPNIHPNFLNCIKEITPKLEEDKIKSYKYGLWRTIPSLETPHLQLESILPKKEGPQEEDKTKDFSHNG
ncbi:MAG: F-box protein [Alphaproteobacteria bacterium]|nr:F-box protein [Alphaproteobacteria bacterium]